MKTINYTEDFAKRFNNAAKNGSTVCAAIMKALKKNDNVRPEVKLNYLTTIRVNHGTVDNTFGCCAKSIKITCCTKDFSNANNPECGSPIGMWRPENRTETNLRVLAGAFKEFPDFTDDDYAYAMEALIMDEPIKIITLSGMKNIEATYYAGNYVSVCGKNDTLWHSCMRYDNTSQVAGDFYANFCGAKIIAAKGTVSGNVYGRAILWPSVNFAGGETHSFVDRVYFVNDAVRQMILKHAKDSGVEYRKEKNTYTDKMTFRNLATGAGLNTEARVYVPKIKWHKKGAPYVDTFSYLYYDGDTFYLSNERFQTDLVAAMMNTNGTANGQVKICPICGSSHSNMFICNACEEKYVRKTIVGRIFVGKMKNGQPVVNARYAQAQKNLEKLL